MLHCCPVVVPVLDFVDYGVYPTWSVTAPRRSNIHNWECLFEYSVPLDVPIWNPTMDYSHSHYYYDSYSSDSVVVCLLNSKIHHWRRRPLSPPPYTPPTIGRSSEWHSWPIRIPSWWVWVAMPPPLLPPLVMYPSSYSSSSSSMYDHHCHSSSSVINVDSYNVVPQSQPPRRD